MQDIVTIHTLQHYAAQDAVEHRHAQAEASIDPADVVSAACERLNDEDSPLLAVESILRSGRALTDDECLQVGRQVSDVVECARLALKDKKLDTAWYVERED